MRCWLLSFFAVPAWSLLASVVVGCFLPVTPGCTLEDSLPGDDGFLTVQLVGRRVASSVYIDQAGKSRFHPDATVWLLSTPGLCRTVPLQDFSRMKESWNTLQALPGERPGERPERPFLAILWIEGDRTRSFFLKPGDLHRSNQLEKTLDLTLRVVEETYGNRFVRELRAAGLESLLPEPP